MVPQQARQPRLPPTVSPVPQALSTTQGECAQRKARAESGVRRLAEGEVRPTIRVQHFQEEARKEESERRKSKDPPESLGRHARVGHRGTCASASTEHSRSGECYGQ